MSTRRIVSDVGGTNVRFAASDADGRLTQIISFPCAAFDSFDAALDSYLAARELPRSLELIVAAAGPVINGEVKLTNNPWTISQSALAGRLGHSSVLLINDLEAVAAALPHLPQSQMRPLGLISPRRSEPQTMLALNVGTGFGAASVIFRGGRWWTCPGEAGHMSLDLSLKGRRHADLTVESVLSGMGLPQLYAYVAGSTAVYDIEKASDVFSRSGDAIAMRTAAVFTTLMGRIAGDLVLATAAWGGVYFNGSVARRWAAIADDAAFRASFENKGRMTERMRHVPSAWIEGDDAALFGMAKMVLG